MVKPTLTIKKFKKSSANSELKKNIRSKDLFACQVLGLDNVNDLARKYRGKFNLTLSAVKHPAKCINNVLNQKLISWETELNRICALDPVIAVENIVDDEGPPESFKYVRENIHSCSSSNLLDPSFLVGCECSSRCSYTKCVCPKNSGGHFAYDRQKRILLAHGSPVYECNKNCKCSIDCPNRVLQNGLTTRVCIFRTNDGRGWGLKTREFIPQNKFVVEYVGEVITSDEAERRGKLYDSIQQTYLFDLDFYDDDNAFTIDACSYGNVSHFINHSCEPNLRVYSVWVDSLDPRLPRIGLYAIRDIQIGEELTFDYLMNSDNRTCRSPIAPLKTNEVKSRNQLDTIERVYCACGTDSCRKYLF